MTEYSNGALFFSTYLGGANDEVNVPNIGPQGGIALDNAGNLYATSYTGSSDFPVTPGSYQTTTPGNGDAFVVKIGSADTSAVVLTPSSLSFTDSDLGPKTTKLLNAGSAQLDFTAFNIQPGANTASNEFIENNDCNLFIAGGASCTITVTFAPQTVGPKSATLQIFDDAGGSAQTQNAALTGNSPGASVLPPFIDFGSVIQGGQSAFMEVIVTSTGVAPLTISNIATTGDFSVPLPNTSGLPACQLLIGSPLATSCRIPVVFLPTATGTRRGTLTITDDALDSPQRVTLAGTGTAKPVISLSAASVNFPGNPVGVNCPTKGVTITNNGPSDLIISSLSGIAAPLSIDASSTCALNTPVASGQSCVINFKFSPTATGTVNQTLTIISNAQGSPHSVGVSGTGTPACALVAKAHTATVLRGTDAQDFAIEDAKPSCSPVNINLSCSAANPVACALAPAVIAPGGASTLKVTNLKALGADSISVRVDSTSEFRAAWETMTVFVSDFAFSHAPDTASVVAGETASYSLAIRPVNGLAGNLSLGCSGAPRGASCAVTPSKITLDGASLAQVKVNVSTTARALGCRSRRPATDHGAFCLCCWRRCWR